LEGWKLVAFHVEGMAYYSGTIDIISLFVNIISSKNQHFRQHVIQMNGLTSKKQKQTPPYPIPGICPGTGI